MKLFENTIELLPSNLAIVLLDSRIPYMFVQTYVYVYDLKQKYKRETVGNRLNVYLYKDYLKKLNSWFFFKAKEAATR